MEYNFDRSWVFVINQYQNKRLLMANYWCWCSWNPWCFETARESKIMATSSVIQLLENFNRILEWLIGIPNCEHTQREWAEKLLLMLLRKLQLSSSTECKISIRQIPNWIGWSRFFQLQVFTVFQLQGHRKRKQRNE